MFFGWGKREPSPVTRRQRVAIRMEAVGGQGAHSAGKILAESAVIGMGYTGNHFSSFGSEKRGSPVRSFVRFAVDHQPVRSVSFIRHPSVVVVFHESLLSTHSEVFEGSGPEVDLLVNTVRRPRDLRFPEGTRWRNVSTINAEKIATETGAGLNAVLLGAVSGLLPELEHFKIKQALEGFFENASARTKQNNQRAFDLGAQQIVTEHWVAPRFWMKLPPASQNQLGWKNAPIGGVILNPGNTVLRDHRVSRKGVIPALDLDLCIHCGYCDMVCPDFCFEWSKEKEPQLQAIHLQYCKACGKCIEICPASALKEVREKAE